MGGEHPDLTLFVGNLHPRATEELLFELFLQAGPALNVRIPKDKDGKPKPFAFVNFKHEESVSYSMNLLNGVKLFGRPLKIHFRQGSSHFPQNKNTAQLPQENSADVGNIQDSNGNRQDEDFMKYSDLPPIQNYQRSYSSPDNLQRQAVMNNFYTQESPHGSRVHTMGQSSPPSSSYGTNDNWYSPSSNHPALRRYDSPPGHRSSRNLASHPYKNESYHRDTSRDMHNRAGQEERHHRSRGQEEHHYRNWGQERSASRNTPRWGHHH